MTMREKIARAALRFSEFNSTDTWEETEDCPIRDWCYAVADAVLDAMREPTEAMIASRAQAHQEAFPDGGTLNTGQVRAFLYANVVPEWQAMIDSAKAEREG